MKEQQVTSYRFARITLDQIDELSKATGLSKANVLSTAIDRMFQQEIKTMTTETYFISEEMLGQFATEKDARHMVELLTERGYIVEYGNQMNKVKPIPDEVWFACLDEVNAFMQMADDTSSR